MSRRIILPRRRPRCYLRLCRRSIESQIGNVTVPVGFDSYPDFLAMGLLLVVTLLVSIGVKVILVGRILSLAADQGRRRCPVMACLHGAIVAAIGRATDRRDRRDDRLV